VSQITGLLLMIALVCAAVSGYYIFYRGFFHESKKNVNMDMPHVTLHGPTSGYPGNTIMLSVKNSGNIDFTSWSFVEGCTESGTDLRVGDQTSVSATLDGAGPWTFKVQAQTTSGKVIEDSWAVEKT
jgi:hypothetical protein